VFRRHYFGGAGVLADAGRRASRQPDRASRQAFLEATLSPRHACCLCQVRPRGSRARRVREAAGARSSVVGATTWNPPRPHVVPT
jgi:hypothetical protein